LADGFAGAAGKPLPHGLDAENLALDADGDDRRNRDDVVVAPGFDVGGVESNVGRSPSIGRLPLSAQRLAPQHQPYLNALARLCWRRVLNCRLLMP
jgi:hypothetical protein